jgi:hypothetical protein
MESGFYVWGVYSTKWNTFYYLPFPRIFSFLFGIRCFLMHLNWVGFLAFLLCIHIGRNDGVWIPLDL